MINRWECRTSKTGKNSTPLDANVFGTWALGHRKKHAKKHAARALLEGATKENGLLDHGTCGVACGNPGRQELGLGVRLAAPLTKKAGQ